MHFLTIVDNKKNTMKYEFYAFQAQAWHECEDVVAKQTPLHPKYPKQAKRDGECSGAASHGYGAPQERRSRARTALHEFLPNCTFDIFQRGRSASPETRNLGIRRYEPHPSRFSHGLFKSTVGCIFRCKAKHPPFRLCTILETDAVRCKARLI